MDVGFLILCPDKNVLGLKNTLRSIESHSYERSSICLVGSNTSKEECLDINKLCKAYKGGSTITSLINLGMKSISNEWAFIIFSGSRLPVYIEKKWSSFCKTDKDILFPVVDRKWDFVDGSFNGVLINKKFFSEIGDFPDIEKYDINDFAFSKLLWAYDALDFGANFKAIIGMNIK